MGWLPHIKFSLQLQFAHQGPEVTQAVDLTYMKFILQLQFALQGPTVTIF